MRIDEQTTDGFLRHLSANGTVKPKGVLSLSTCAAIELALWAASDGNSLSALSGLRREHAVLEQAIQFTLGQTPLEPDFSAKLSQEFFVIRDPSDVLGIPWKSFLSRYTLALQRSGFGKLSYALADALQEMVVNISDHSTIGTQSNLHGIVSYEVDADSMCFVVADRGVGALASLKTNPEWSHISSSREAVLAIAQSKASRRIGQGEGQGYRDLFVAITSFNGLLRLRSGNGIFIMSGSLGSCSPTGASVPHINGVQLTVKCRK